MQSSPDSPQTQAPLSATALPEAAPATDVLSASAETQAFIANLRQRLLDTTSCLRGVAAVVEGMNKGAADSLAIAIRALDAVCEDMQSVGRETRK